MASLDLTIHLKGPGSHSYVFPMTMAEQEKILGEDDKFGKPLIH